MKRQVLDRYDGTWTAGLDLSAYQADVDYPRVARSELLLGRGDRRRSLGKPAFCIVRAADGVQTRRNSKPDPFAVRHLVGCAEAGLLVDVYIYVRAFHDPAAQVAIVLDVIRTSGVAVRTVWLDLEGRADDPTTPDTDESHGLFWHPSGTPAVTVDAALGCVREMRRLFEGEGYRVGIYTAVLWHWLFAQKGIDVSGFGSCPLWTAYYTTSRRYKLPVGPRGEAWPWEYADIWQAGGSSKVPGTIAGIEGPVDANLYRGDLTALRRFWDPALHLGERATSPPPATLRGELVAGVQSLAELAKREGDQGAVAELLKCATKLAG